MTTHNQWPTFPSCIPSINIYLCNYEDRIRLGIAKSDTIFPLVSTPTFHYLCEYEDRLRFGIVKSETRFPFVSALTFHYICCNLKYLIWLSTLCRKLAWERATDKKIPSCLESLYSSCFQITLFSWCKGSIFSWLPVIFGHKISRSFQETYTADMTAIP